MRKRSRIVAVATVGMLMATLFAIPASATLVGDEGCTPGYWKNHPDAWSEGPGDPISIDKTFESAFPGVEYPGVTLMEALQGGGGNGIVGARRILARAASAAWLNAATEEFGYPLRRDQFIPLVVAAWDDRDAALALAATLDGYNNLGCPL